VIEDGASRWIDELPRWIQERLVLALSGAWLNLLRIIGACNVSPRG
jgi:hypothetical protein